MDDNARIALEGSIEKWQRIVDGSGRDEGAKNCPLCKLFNNVDTDDVCAGCPVAESTGQTGCDDTPFENWCMQKPPGGRAETSKQKQAAKEELDFLVSLHPNAASKYARLT